MAKWRASTQSILLVGEGRDDAAFLKHLKSLTSANAHGISFQIRNAKGGSPITVLDWAYAQSLQASYDEVWVLIDRDVIINAMNSVQVDQHATKLGLNVLLSIECLEEMLLRIKGVPPLRRILKAQLTTVLEGSATDPSNYQGPFDSSTLFAARSSEPTLNQLLTIFKL